MLHGCLDEGGWEKITRTAAPIVSCFQPALHEVLTELFIAHASMVTRVDDRHVSSNLAACPASTL